ncbi:hypothetical protein G195_006539 [Phytophthora kernoviae 00238/432]|uniref:RxLR effector protein n=1 Tax=Phytophthora kernoviae 00238/432 TaxID=1284355 RepID=A0A8J4SEF5_9STRA|nr:hypothetical protein G195_006539 [Phytophthora kernoviae 00238/432]
MKLNALILAMAIMLTLLGSSSANLEGENILRRQLRVGKMVASLFENEHQTKRDLEAQMEDEDNKPKEVQAEPSRFRMRRLRSPNYVELEEPLTLLNDGGDAPPYTGKPTRKPLTLLNDGGDAPPYTGRPLTLLYNGGDMQPVIAEDF